MLKVALIIFIESYTKGFMFTVMSFASTICYCEHTSSKNFETSYDYRHRPSKAFFFFFLLFHCYGNGIERENATMLTHLAFERRDEGWGSGRHRWLLQST